MILIKNLQGRADMPKLVLFVVVAFLFSATPSHSTLIDRGGGLIYDTDLNITWLQDANYAMSAGHSLDGYMKWKQAMDWVENLNYYDSVRGVTWDDWRLPATNPPTPDYVYGYDGTTSGGYNITSSEMGHLYYFELGNKGVRSTSDIYQPGYGTEKSTTPFINLQNTSTYWTSTEYAPYTYYAWAFNVHAGLQYAETKSVTFYAWAVRDGDVVPVPEPSTLLLLGAGLVGIIPLRRLIRAC